jgi:membrane-associated protein
MSAASFISPNHLIDTFGLIGLFVIIFAECGLLIGFFMPGDTLLFTAGLLVSNHLLHKPLWAILVITPIAAILGNFVGYWIGWRSGPAIFNRPDSRLFKQEHVERAHTFFERYGPATIFLARFVPVVRTFVTVMAGVSRMRFSVYATFTILGGLVWTLGVTIAGYYLGKIKIIRDNVDLILILGVACAVCVSALPLTLRYINNRRGNSAAPRHAAPASRPESAVSRDAD